MVDDPEPAQAYGVRPISYETAVKLALDRTAQGAIETLWSGALAAVPRGTPDAEKLHDTEGMFFDRRVRHFRASKESAFQAVVRIGGDEGWYTFDWLWQLRGILDRMVGGVGMRRGRRDQRSLQAGDALDFWRVEIGRTERPPATPRRDEGTGPRVAPLRRSRNRKRRERGAADGIF